MSHPSQFLIDHYQQLDGLLRQQDIGIGISESHGVGCGLVCRGRTELDDDQWGELLADENLSTSVLDTLNGVHALAMRALHSEQLAFDLLLPDEEEEIRQQVEALSEWCTGFLRGFLATGKANLDETGNEAIEDMHAISNIEIDQMMHSIISMNHIGTLWSCPVN